MTKNEKDIKKYLLHYCDVIIDILNDKSTNANDKIWLRKSILFHFKALAARAMTNWDGSLENSGANLRAKFHLIASS